MGWIDFDNDGFQSADTVINKMCLDHLVTYRV